MEDFEKLGAFYLGRPFDLKEKKPIGWTAGKDLDIAALIQQIQTPPLTKVGVMDLDSFFPSKDRFKVAMAFNNTRLTAF